MKSQSVEFITKLIEGLEQKQIEKNLKLQSIGGDILNYKDEIEKLKRSITTTNYRIESHKVDLQIAKHRNITKNFNSK